MYEGLTEIFQQVENLAPTAALVFTRVAAVVALLPGFGELMLPLRVKLAGAVAFSMVVWPTVAPALAGIGANGVGLVTAILAEAAVGTLVGLSVRLLVMALQLAGSIAAQTTSVAQMFGAGATPDPMPAIGNLLFLGGIALVMAGGLHVKAALSLIETYRLFPVASVPDPGEVAAWGVGGVARAFRLAFTLAAPFLVASFAYNLALGAINRAMPALAVAFIGAPAITAGSIALLAVVGGTILMVWSGHVEDALIRLLR